MKRDILDAIVNAVCDVYGLPRSRVVSQKRHRPLVDARVTIALIAKRLGFDNYEIAEVLNRDRTSPYHYFEVGETRLDLEPAFAARARQSLRRAISERNRLQNREKLSPARLPGRVVSCG